jgi:hypothetical protein
MLLGFCTVGGRRGVEARAAVGRSKSLDFLAVDGQTGRYAPKTRRHLVDANIVP